MKTFRRAFAEAAGMSLGAAAGFVGLVVGVAVLIELVDLVESAARPPLEQTTTYQAAVGMWSR